VLPLTDWALVAMKPVITCFLRRLDKMMAKIHKNHRIYVAADWKAISVILSGIICCTLLGQDIFYSYYSLWHVIITCDISGIS
jgi:hypothetical protein